jgi:hypothetical protein
MVTLSHPLRRNDVAPAKYTKGTIIVKGMDPALRDLMTDEAHQNREENKRNKKKKGWVNLPGTQKDVIEAALRDRYAGTEKLEGPAKDAERVTEELLEKGAAGSPLVPDKMVDDATDERDAPVVDPMAPETPEEPVNSPDAPESAPEAPESPTEPVEISPKAAEEPKPVLAKRKPTLPPNIF